MRREIEHCIEVTQGRLFLLSSTSINPDPKLENIAAAFAFAHEHPIT